MTNAAQLENFFNIATKTGFWRKITLDYLQSIHPQGASSEQISAALNESEDDIQPRTAELSACDKDLIRGLGRGVNSKGNPVTIWYYNPEPKPRPREMKPVGNKELWGKMIQAAYEQKHAPNAYHLHRMTELAKAWITDFSNNLPERKPCTTEK